jgi:very-short-patch-repair endonuclease
MERYGPGRGAVNARRLVDLARAGGVSSPERLTLHALLRNGTERWKAGFRVQLGPAEEYWLDLVIEEVRLCVEVDGWKVHSRAEAFHTDRDRQNVLALAGWTVLRYTPRRLRNDVDGVVAEVLAMAAALRRAGVEPRVKDDAR